MTRYAIRLTVNAERDLRVVQRYLPSNYSASAVSTPDGPGILISGIDVAGWTLGGYVLPRLASGNLSAREVYTADLLDYTPLPSL